MRQPPWFPEGFQPDEWRIEYPSGTGSSTRHLDRVLAELARLQHGVVATRQLLWLGATRRQVTRRRASGHLHGLHQGVHAVGYPRLTAAGTRMAAVLAAGDGARLAGWSGAAHRGLLPDAGRRIDLALPPGRRTTIRGVDIRRVPGTVVVWDGIPCHDVAHLLLDVAAVNGEGPLERAWRQAVYLGCLDVAAVEHLLDSRRGDPGTPALRALHRRRAGLVGTLRNDFELLMLSIIREAGLPEPLCNAAWEVAPGVVLRPDFRIPELHLVVEADGRDGHADVEQRWSDAQRDTFYAANRHRGLRYGWWEATRERARVVAELRACRGSCRPRRT